jgi:hypothetical protein
MLILVYNSNPTADNTVLNSTVGVISTSVSGWSWPWVPSRYFADRIHLYAVCANGNLEKFNTSIKEIEPRDEQNKRQLISLKFNFTSSLEKEAGKICNGDNNVKGYVYDVSLSESNFSPTSREEHYIGRDNHDFGKGSAAEEKIKNADPKMLFSVKDWNKNRNKYIILDAANIANL